MNIVHIRVYVSIAAFKTVLSIHCAQIHTLSVTIPYTVCIHMTSCTMYTSDCNMYKSAGKCMHQYKLNCYTYAQLIVWLYLQCMQKLTCFTCTKHLEVCCNEPTSKSSCTLRIYICRMKGSSMQHWIVNHLFEVYTKYASPGQGVWVLELGMACWSSVDVVLHTVGTQVVYTLKEGYFVVTKCIGNIPVPWQIRLFVQPCKPTKHLHVHVHVLLHKVL